MVVVRTTGRVVLEVEERGGSRLVALVPVPHPGPLGHIDQFWTHGVVGVEATELPLLQHYAVPSGTEPCVVWVFYAVSDNPRYGEFTDVRFTQSLAGDQCRQQAQSIPLLELCAVRYMDEHVRRKVGKAGASAT